MPSPSIAPEPTDPAALDPHTQRHRAWLDEMIEMGVDVTRILHKQIRVAAERAEADPTVAIPPALAVNFDRIVRTVRKSMLLFRELGKPLPGASSERQRRMAREAVIRAVEDNIHRHADEDEADALHGELLDRLDRPDLDDEIAGRPLAEIIADICRDLGLAALPGNDPWKRRTPADIATLKARAAARPRGQHGAAPAPEPGRPPGLQRIRGP